MKSSSLNLSSTFLRLRNDASIEPLPVDETFWHRIMEGQLGSFHNEFLVTIHGFDSDWLSWEMHPKGDEVVCLLSGSVIFIMDTSEGKSETKLDKAGAFVFVPKGTWHTAKVNSPSQVLFITAGEGTEHREMDP